VRRGRTDANQTEIVAFLRAAGASVFVSSDVGRGFPDLVVGHRGHTYLIEVKVPGGRIRDSQSAFALSWRGSPVCVVRNVQDCFDVLAGKQ